MLGFGVLRLSVEKEFQLFTLCLVGFEWEFFSEVSWCTQVGQQSFYETIDKVFTEMQDYFVLFTFVV